MQERDVCYGKPHVDKVVGSIAVVGRLNTQRLIGAALWTGLRASYPDITLSAR
jgi:hypothetical protein